MAHGVSEVLGEGSSVKMVHQKQQQQQQQQSNATRKSVGVMGSRRIFAPAFKLKVLDSYRNDIDCRGNQRATARKYGIHRRQIQKWLQCEDNLRNSCAESGSGAAVSATLISPAALTKQPDSGVTEATTAAPAVTPAPAAPALNLSLARLHGDELATQQGPPPLLPRPPHGASPSSPQYVPRSGTSPVLSARLGYHEYQLPADHPRRHLHRDAEETNYYILNGDGSSTSTASFDARPETKVYQTLTAYGPLSSSSPSSSSSTATASSSLQDRYDTERYATDADTRRHRSPPCHPRIQHSYGDVDSSMEDGKAAYGSLLAPSMIKTERASPDSAATPGPCESPAAPAPASSSVPHARVLASPDPEKPRPTETFLAAVTIAATPIGAEKGLSDISQDTRMQSSVIKEEIHPKEEESATCVDEGRESSDYLDYPRPAGADSRGASPVPGREAYSLPSSPREPTSSGSSCSDSEMDPLDCSSGSQHSSSNDLSRRRSFSLRFKLDVLDAFHRDAGVAGNQRATARKFGINRRQVQKWLGQETELRGEIAVRGNTRQRLGPVQDAGADSPVDLRTSTYASSLSLDRMEPEYERSPPPPLYCCHVGSSSASSSSSSSSQQQHLAAYYRHPGSLDASPESEAQAACNLSCCAPLGAPCYQETIMGAACYADPQTRLYCYSPRDYTSELAEQPEERLPSPLKRQHCTLSCCYEPHSSPKRLCVETEDPPPPQDTPLCLVKPKRPADASPSGMEPVTSTVPTPPAQPRDASSRKDAILFKPYLDNPVTKPSKEAAIQRAPSPQNIVSNNNNNNNCQSVCNLNEGHDYALELSLRLPVSWRTHPAPYTEFPQVRSAFVRYPASPHYS